MILGVDIGGTFTDVVCIDQAAREIGLTKVITNHAHIVESVISGVSKILGLLDRQPEGVERIVLGTTLATNVVVQRAGARLAIFTTDPFRLRYRELIADCVRDIVTKMMDKRTTTAYLRRRASETLPSADGARLVDVVEMEVMSLHEGNIARFRLSPPEFEAWKEIWR